VDWDNTEGRPRRDPTINTGGSESAALIDNQQQRSIHPPRPKRQA
jgi:hypothetical protein